MKFVLSCFALALFVAAANAASCDGNCGDYAGGFTYARCSCLDSCRTPSYYDDCCADYAQYCTRKKACRKPPAVDYATFTPSKNWYPHGDKITYTCVSNNYGINFDKRTCDDGVWSTAPQCRRVVIVVCRRPDLGRHQIGFTPYKNSYLRDAQVTYRCKPGCRIVGNPRRKCTATASWTSLPTCECGCKHFGALSFGRYSPPKTSWAYGDEARFTCRDGYWLDGRPLSRCVKGVWNSPKPVCRRYCADREHPQYGSASRPANGYWRVGSTVTYECDESYRLRGSKSATCRYNGVWSHSVPTCVRTCANRRGPAYGKGSSPKDGYWYVGDTVNYKCQDQYRLRGHSSAICRYNGVWSHPVPRCVRTCPNRASPAYGSASSPEDGYWYVGDTVTYTCNNNYNLVGSASANCRYNGVWSSAVPTCILTTCPSRSDPVNGRTSPPQDVWNVGDTAFYACGAYYDLVGSNSAKCQLGGVWSEDVPICIDKTCAGRCTAEVDSELPCQCLPGCVDTDEYKCCPDSLICPIEEPRPECSPMKNPKWGQIVGVGPFYDGMVVIFLCEHPYSILGGHTLATCKNGEWDNPPHTCAASCREPKDIRYGEVFGKIKNKVYKHGHEIYYACKGEYRLPLGRPVFQSICSHGIWKPRAPTCSLPIRIDYSTCKGRCGSKKGGGYTCGCELTCAFHNRYISQPTNCCADYRRTCVARNDPH